MFFRTHFPLFLFVFFQNYLWAQPANNNCTGAVSVLISATESCDNAVQGTTVNATDSGINSCYGYPDDDVWYKFVATATTRRIKIDGNSLGDPVLEVFSGTCSSLNSLVCVDNSSGSSEETSVSGLTIGDTYFIRTYSWSEFFSQGTFSVCVLPPPLPPVNDNCVDAAELIPSADLTCASTVQGTTLGASTSSPGCSGDADDDVWYYFTATSVSHIVTLSNVVYSNGFFSPVIEVFSGSCNALTSIACTSFTDRVLLTNLNVGETYRVRIYTYEISGAMSFSVCVRTPPAPPVNDECAGSINLPVNGANCVTSVAGTTAGGTLSSFGCTGNSDDDVWFKFVATGPTHIVTLSNVIPVSAFDSYDMVMEAFSGNCASLTSIKCSDYDQMVLTGLTAGDTYRVRVYSYYLAYYSSFSICVTTPLPGPVNDACAGAVTLIASSTATCSNPVTGNTTGAYNSAALSGCFGSAEDDVWYKFTAVAETQRITVEGITIQEPVLQVFTGDCANPTPVFCKSVNFSSDISVSLDGFTVGETYWVRVYSYSADISAEGTFNICVTTESSVLVNDACTGAIELQPNTSLSCTLTTQGDNTGAFNSLTPACSGTADDDVWFKFTATSSTHVVTVTPGSVSDLVVEVFAGSCSGLEPFACIDNTFSSEETATLTGLTVGEVYHVRVFSYYSDPAYSGTFTVCIGTLQAPSNDNCNTATALTITANCSNPLVQNSETASPSATSANCSGNPDDDLWYSFQATSPQHTIIVDGSADFDAVIEVFSGSCNGTLIGCRDNGFSGETETYELTGLVTGAVYRFRVYDYYSGGGGFTVCVTGLVSGTDALPAESAQIKVFPNPVADQITIDIPKQHLVKSITLLNAQSVVCRETISPENTGKMDLSGLPAGLYVVRIQTEKGLFFSRVVKQ